jgi:hypothetical protein
MKWSPSSELQSYLDDAVENAEQWGLDLSAQHPVFFATVDADEGGIIIAMDASEYGSMQGEGGWYSSSDVIAEETAEVIDEDGDGEPDDEEGQATLDAVQAYLDKYNDKIEAELKTKYAKRRNLRRR